MNLRFNKPYLRSASFQLLMFAGTFVGAVVLASVALFLRASVFEPYCRARFPELKETVYAKELAEGKADPKKLGELPIAEQHALFGTWIDDPAAKLDGPLAKGLLSLPSDSILSFIRPTLVAGDRAQRERALRLLAEAPVQDRLDEADRLCRQAGEKAARRGETDLARLAEATRSRLRR